MGGCGDAGGGLGGKIGRGASGGFGETGGIWVQMDGGHWGALGASEMPGGEGGGFRDTKGLWGQMDGGRGGGDTRRL